MCLTGPEAVCGPTQCGPLRVTGTALVSNVSCVKRAYALRAELLRWELVGIPIIFCCGSALHFAFEWCGRLPIVAPFAAVNESVWEHLKLAFWPAVLYAVVEYAAFGKDVAGFGVAKSVGILAMPLCVVLLFYGYKALLGHHVLWLDILIFLVAVSVGQASSCLLLAAERRHAGLEWVGLAALFLLGLCFAAFSFRPPRLPIFQDSVTGKYGLQQ